MGGETGRKEAAFAELNHSLRWIGHLTTYLTMISHVVGKGFLFSGCHLISRIEDCVISETDIAAGQQVSANFMQVLWCCASLWKERTYLKLVHSQTLQHPTFPTT